MSTVNMGFLPAQFASAHLTRDGIAARTRDQTFFDKLIVGLGKFRPIGDAT